MFESREIRFIKDITTGNESWMLYTYKTGKCKGRHISPLAAAKKLATYTYAHNEIINTGELEIVRFFTQPIDNL